MSIPPFGSPPPKVMTGDSGSGGTAGYVPAPSAGDSSKYLKGDGTWGAVSGGSDATLLDTWRFRTSLGGSPATGDFTFSIGSGFTGSSSMAVHFNETSSNSVSWATTIQALPVGTTFVIMQTSNPSNYIILQVRTLATDNGTYDSMPVMCLASVGFPISDNTLCNVYLPTSGGYGTIYDTSGTILTRRPSLKVTGAGSDAFDNGVQTTLLVPGSFTVPLTLGTSNGSMIEPISYGDTTLAMAVGDIYYMPIIFSRDFTVDRFTFEVTTAAGAGGVMDVGILTANGTLPNAVIASSTGNATTSTGVKQITLTGATFSTGGALDVGGWLAILCRVSGCTVRSAYPMKSTQAVPWTSNSSFTVGHGWYKETGITSFTDYDYGGSLVQYGPRCMLRRSA